MEGERGTEETGPWHKPKEGSIFPKERSSVKQMIGIKVKEVVVDLVESTVKKASKKVWPAHEASETTDE
ncbi:hypothetical protein VNO80_18688 [Phaseolus coccineus]|uniref:Uncharacterized protein n=1 Tax=Phaseolus coccineus TaxID=3886 RepID=A0AAN9MF41_PHACN